MYLCFNLFNIKMHLQQRIIGEYIWIKQQEGCSQEVRFVRSGHVCWWEAPCHVPREAWVLARTLVMRALALRGVPLCSLLLQAVE